MTYLHLVFAPEISLFYFNAAPRKLGGTYRVEFLETFGKVGQVIEPYLVADFSYVAVTRREQLRGSLPDKLSGLRSVRAVSFR